MGEEKYNFFEKYIVYSWVLLRIKQNVHRKTNVFIQQSETIDLWVTKRVKEKQNRMPEKYFKRMLRPTWLPSLRQWPTGCWPRLPATWRGGGWNRSGWLSCSCSCRGWEILRRRQQRFLYAYFNLMANFSIDKIFCMAHLYFIRAKHRVSDIKIHFQN